MAPLLLSVLLAGALVDTPGRLRPPPDVTCERDHLTSYTGQVVSFRRSSDELSITIQTDWDTTETVRLAPLRLDKLRLGGAPFKPDDWARLEAAPGTPRPDLRATAWLCDDGRPLLIDWQPAGASAKPE